MDWHSCQFHRKNVRSRTFRFRFLEVNADILYGGGSEPAWWILNES